MCIFEIRMPDVIQVELMVTQLRLGRRRKHLQDMELALDLMVLSSETDERMADVAIIERLAKKLDLHTFEDLKKETIAVRNLSKERGQTSECVVQVIDILNKFKQMLGMEVTDIFKESVKPKMLEKSMSFVIPHEFLCPITLDVMRDPVIIASGQTFERESIQKWFDSNNRTCPKTRQTLAHLSLVPNHALKNLITQWCEKNNYKHPNTEDLESSQGSSVKEEEISSLVEELSSSELEVLLRAVKDIHMLSKEHPESRVLFTNCGAIPALVQLLRYLNPKINSMPRLEKWKYGVEREFHRSFIHLIDARREQITIALSEGIPALVQLLETGMSRGKTDAVTALFNLCLNQANKARAIDAGIVPPLKLLVKDKRMGMVDEALSMFLLLVTHPQGRYEIGQLFFIGVLVDIIRDGTRRIRSAQPRFFSS
ncbi:U-box domain-containing protein 15 [Hibiscus syriacus]|uniref:RING-type E3 ubiquitin transferase n=1 Tax=Hibiscus syriacus TaxID=106335 RepID=A0A6A3BVB6_HIBSY|nr:U-box domain-containing protein 15 [Hibiscus syriacus]